MDRIPIGLQQLIDLSEGEDVTLHCAHCLADRAMKPVVQVSGNRSTLIADVKRGFLVELPDVQDAHVVECGTCGMQYVAAYDSHIKKD